MASPHRGFAQQEVVAGAVLLPSEWPRPLTGLYRALSRWAFDRVAFLDLGPAFTPALQIHHQQTAGGDPDHSLNYGIVHVFPLRIYLKTCPIQEVPREASFSQRSLERLIGMVSRWL
jgi:hypothetical protein